MFWWLYWRTFDGKLTITLANWGLHRQTGNYIDQVNCLTDFSSFHMQKNFFWCSKFHVNSHLSDVRVASLGCLLHSWGGASCCCCENNEEGPQKFKFLGGKSKNCKQIYGNKATPIGDFWTTCYFRARNKLSKKTYFPAPSKMFRLLYESNIRLASTSGGYEDIGWDCGRRTTSGWSNRL